jgi:hypothetical protein
VEADPAKAHLPRVFVLRFCEAALGQPLREVLHVAGAEVSQFGPPFPAGEQIACLDERDLMCVQAQVEKAADHFMTQIMKTQIEKARSIQSKEVKVVARQPEVSPAQNNLHVCRMSVRRSDRLGAGGCIDENLGISTHLYVSHTMCIQG